MSKDQRFERWLSFWVRVFQRRTKPRGRRRRVD
jgi:hypothetical protein